MDETILQKDGGKHKNRSQWELIKQPLYNQLKFSGNVLWCEAAKARAKAYKPPRLFERVTHQSRIANLGSLSHIPKANIEYNKRLCIVSGDICALAVDALVVPIDSSELCARVHALAGQELETALKRQTISLGDAGLTQAFQIAKDGLPQLLFHCSVPSVDDPTSLKQAYDRAFYMADLEGVTTMAVPVMSGVSYPVGGDYYPLVAAVHVMLGCIRQQFEKSKNSHFILLCIVCQTDREKQVVNDLIELYFPHDAENEIPDDLDEKVEVVVEEKTKKKKSAKKSGKKSGKKKK
uniref:Macro domain-containing protein n=1 Tax=Trepomonas sp. PC1 TaxID=1076344 RepID=A0A146K5K0_9EUKA|eukprot:JAP91135.1 Macro domain-containing protein [Trepomonas sp. PC1]